MLDQLIKSLQGFRVANQPVGEGAILTINMMLGQIGMILGKRIARKMNIPVMPAKLLGDGAAIVGLPMLVKGIRLGGDNATDRLSVALIAMSVNDVLGTEQIVNNMLKAVPFLSGGELGAADYETFQEVPVEDTTLALSGDGSEEIEPINDLALAGAGLAGIEEEDYMASIIALQKD